MPEATPSSAAASRLPLDPMRMALCGWQAPPHRCSTIRIHLDDVPPTNAPLLIAPGSHRLGMVREAAIDAVVARHGVHACLAEAGDIWVYSTPILHASEAARDPQRRRVLQVDYAAFDLPSGLVWSGI